MLDEEADLEEAIIEQQAGCWRRPIQPSTGEEVTAKEAAEAAAEQREAAEAGVEVRRWAAAEARKWAGRFSENLEQNRGRSEAAMLEDLTFIMHY